MEAPAAADRLRLAAGAWEAVMLPAQGAAMARLAWRGEDVLVPLPLGADPTQAFCGAFVMAPWANRLDRGRLPVTGTLHLLPVNRPEDDTAIHGLSRDHPWRVADSAPDRAVLEQALDGPAMTPPLPYHYAARLEVRLDPAGLSLSLALTNLTEAPFPFGLGWHPFFLRVAETRLRFRATTLLARDARCLPVAVRPTDGVDGGAEAYEGLDTHFAGWEGSAEIARPGLSLRLTAAGAWGQNLQVFAPAGGTVLCVEPVSHLPDAPNRPEFAALGPLVMLPPGGAISGTLRIAAAE
ncbi:MAG TPA: aldose epimerase [Crenalkalicoccus sp.]|nr:aldose epimerase [Crenalkalicoccus sp.]